MRPSLATVAAFFWIDWTWAAQHIKLCLGWLPSMMSGRPKTSQGAVPESCSVLFHRRMIDEPVTHAQRRRTAIVRYNGVYYRRNLSLCRQALTQRQIEGEYLRGVIELAEALGCSRSTVTRFFNGRNVSTAVTLTLLNALHLSFEEVHAPTAGTGR